MSSLTPVIKYTFESWTPGSTTIINEGSSGSTNDGVLQNSAIVISSDYAVGTQFTYWKSWIFICLELFINSRYC